MKLLPLSNDFVFKAIFARKPDLLLDLLNSFPEFSGERKNPEILLTEDFEIHILELPKQKKNIQFIIFNHFMQFLTIKRT